MEGVYSFHSGLLDNGFCVAAGCRAVEDGVIGVFAVLGRSAVVVDVGSGVEAGGGEIEVIFSATKLRMSFSFLEIKTERGGAACVLK